MLHNIENLENLETWKLGKLGKLGNLEIVPVHMEQCKACRDEDICEYHVGWMRRMVDISLKGNLVNTRFGFFLVRQIICDCCFYEFPMHPRLHVFIDEYLRRIEVIRVDKDPYKCLSFDAFRCTRVRHKFNAIKVDTRQLPQIKGLFRR